MKTSEIIKSVNKLEGVYVFKGEDDIIIHDAPTSDPRWKPRPVGGKGFSHKLRCAYLVLRGRADIVVWLFQK